MSEKSRIKNAFTKRKYSESFATQSSMEKSSKCSFFIPICFGIFVFHWIIVCPLVFGILYRTIYTEGWPHYWPQLFWTVALVLYLVIMVVFLVFWRRRKQKEARSCENPETIALERSKKLKTLDSIEEENDAVALRRPEPLVIDKEKEMDGEQEDGVEVKSEESLSRVSREINRSSMKEYLRIVTVETPSPGGGRTCGTPMTPRDLFFIDLIKNAEKEEEMGRCGPVFRYDKEKIGREEVEGRSAGGDDGRERTQGTEDDGGTSPNIGKSEDHCIEEMRSKQNSGDFSGAERGRGNLSEDKDDVGGGHSEKSEIIEKLETHLGAKIKNKGQSEELSEVERERVRLADETDDADEEMSRKGEHKMKKLGRINKLESDVIEEIKMKQKSDDFCGLNTRKNHPSEDDNEKSRQMDASGQIRRASDETSEAADTSRPQRVNLTGAKEDKTPVDDEVEDLMKIKDLRIVSTQKQLIDKKPSEFPEIKPRMRATYVEVARKKTNLDEVDVNSSEDQVLSTKRVDTRRYTMGSAAFKDLLGTPDTRRLSKSETTLARIAEQSE